MGFTVTVTLGAAHSELVTMPLNKGDSGESSILWKVTVSVIVRKTGHTIVCLIFNGYRDKNFRTYKKKKTP